MKLSEFFDVNNLDHVKAYQHLVKEGAWPKEFIDTLPNKDMVLTPPSAYEPPAYQIWIKEISMKIAKAWCEDKLASQNEDSKYEYWELRHRDNKLRDDGTTLIIKTLKNQEDTNSDFWGTMKKNTDYISLVNKVKFDKAGGLGIDVSNIKQK